eukprot:1553352-Amphidinium_carterae.1
MIHRTTSLHGLDPSPALKAFHCETRHASGACMCLPPSWAAALRKQPMGEPSLKTCAPVTIVISQQVTTHCLQSAVFLKIHLFRSGESPEMALNYTSQDTTPYTSQGQCCAS